MARPVTQGLHYFPKDVDFYLDDRILDLKYAYGPLGLAVYDVLLTMIYRSGYYLEIPQERLVRTVYEMVGARWVESAEQLLAVIRYCVQLGLFDAGLFEKGVLTSRAIQRRYREVTARCKKDRSRYWLLDEPQAETDAGQAEEGGPGTGAGVNAAITPVNATLTPVSAPKEKESKGNQKKEKQSKEKESKEKEMKENDRKIERAETKPAAPEKTPPENPDGGIDAPPVKKPYGHYQNVMLTDQGHQSLKAELGGYLAGYIERLSSYMAAKGDRYPDHEATLRNWYSGDLLTGRVKKPEHTHQPSFDLEAFARGGFDLPGF